MANGHRQYVPGAPYVAAIWQHRSGPSTVVQSLA